MNTETYKRYAEKFEKAIDLYVEYRTTHDDSGSEYYNDEFHMLSLRLREFLEEHEIEADDDTFEALMEELIYDCPYRPGYQLESLKNGVFNVDTVPVGEVEDAYCFEVLCELLELGEEETGEFVTRALQDQRFCLASDGNGGVVSFVLTDATWVFEVDLEWIEHILEGLT